jgi:hypothetical protein
MSSGNYVIPRLGHQAIASPIAIHPSLLFGGNDLATWWPACPVARVSFYPLVLLESIAIINVFRGP